MSFELIQSIVEEINFQKEMANDLEMEVLNELHNHLNVAMNAKWSRDDLSKKIENESEALLDIEEGSGFYKTVKSIQHKIIDALGEQ
ncbi:hypothetical protein [Agarilytica rhodophyticola]|uniref:hypothetical protein n=1 Tax=Agarilytica rhodophyticola TaxID=1737490 RepID=UPI000B346EB5|nr:hypothetical protein [Agarilytica rhodophyticola]